MIGVLLLFVKEELDRRGDGVDEVEELKGEDDGEEEGRSST
jgi:hypothetical protein